MSMIDAHDLIDIIENDFKNDNIQITIHIDPVIVGNKKIDKMKDEIINLLKKLDKDLDIHDFRMIESSKKVKILFDCVVPYDKNYTSLYLSNYLKDNINDKDNKNVYVIEIDRPHC